MTGQELKAALKSLGLSQIEFAKETGNTNETISRWAQGKRPVPLLAQRYLDLRLKVRAAQDVMDEGAQRR